MKMKDSPCRELEMKMLDVGIGKEQQGILEIS